MQRRGGGGAGAGQKQASHRGVKEGNSNQGIIPRKPGMDASGRPTNLATRRPTATSGNPGKPAACIPPNPTSFATKSGEDPRKFGEEYPPPQPSRLRYEGVDCNQANPAKPGDGYQARGRRVKVCGGKGGGRWIPRKATSFTTKRSAPTRRNATELTPALSL